MNKSIHRSLYGILVIMLISCSSKSPVWIEIQDVNPAAWNASDQLTYHLEVQDSLTLYDLLIDIRNREDYEYANLYLFIETSAPNKGISVDTINCQLAAVDGKWLGDGSYSEFKTLRILFRRNIRFPVTGSYQIQVRHGMRTDPLKGIANIGLLLIEHQQNNN